MSKKYIYQANKGIIQIASHKIKKSVAALAVTFGIVGMAAVPAFALYGTQPGFDVSNSNTSCAGHGSFGAFGANGDVRHDFGGGANSDATAYNNSTLCGNPSSNSSAATLGDQTN